MSDAQHFCQRCGAMPQTARRNNFDRVYRLAALLNLGHAGLEKLRHSWQALAALSGWNRRARHG